MWTKRKSIIVTLLVSNIIFYILYILAMTYWAALSRTPWMLYCVSMGVIVWWTIDKYILKGVDTIDEIKKGNIAWALLVVGILLAVIFAFNI